MGPETPEEMAGDLMFLLDQTGHALQAELRAALAELEITPRDYCVLVTAASGELTQGEVAQLSALDKTTMVVTLDALERAGLAERRPSPTDRRARIVAVTDEGVARTERARAIVGEVYDGVLATLPARQRTALVEGLVTLAGGRLSTPVVGVDGPLRRKRSG